MRGRKWADYMVLSVNSGPAATPTNHLTIPAYGLYVFPQGIGLYPLRQFTQFELYVLVSELPEGGTYVGVTLFAFKGFLNDAGASSNDLGSFDNSAAVVYDVYPEQVLVPDTTNLFTTSFDNEIRLPAETTQSYNTVTYEQGQRFSFPIREDFLGIRIRTDGADFSGQFSLFAVLTGAVE
jgi:hypothetical protein